MQDLAELHRSSRPATFLSDLGKPKASSPKNQVIAHILGVNQADGGHVHELLISLLGLTLRPQNDVRVKFEFKGEKR